MNTLQVKAGSSFLCFGAGAVGMSALLAAKVCGADRIIAVDTVASRLALAIELGATDVIDGQAPGALEVIRQLTGGGADFVLDTTGVPDVITLAIESLGHRGSVGLVAGIGDKRVQFDITRLYTGGRTITGIIEGDSVARVFIPLLVALHRQGRFPFDRFVKFYEFHQINQAAEDSISGTAIKPVLRMADMV